MKAISIINYKGGVGKTTIAANLAVGLAARGRRTLAIDLDPQTNLTFSFIKPEDWAQKYSEERTLKNWFDDTLRESKVGSLESCIIENPRGMDVDIIASHLGLVETEMALSAPTQKRRQKPPCSRAMRFACYLTRRSGGCPRQKASNTARAANDIGAGFSLIKTALRPLAQKYDVVLFDCPPSFGALTRLAIVASELFLVPARMDFLSTIGVEQLRHRVREFSLALEEAHATPGPEFLGVVANMVAYNREQVIGTQKAYVDRLVRDGITVFDTKLRDSKTAYGAAPEMGVFPINNRRFQAAAELNDLTDEFIKRAGV